MEEKFAVVWKMSYGLRKVAIHLNASVALLAPIINRRTCPTVQKYYKNMTIDVQGDV